MVRLTGLVHGPKCNRSYTPSSLLMGSATIINHGNSWRRYEGLLTVFWNLKHEYFSRRRDANSIGASHLQLSIVTHHGHCIRGIFLTRYRANRVGYLVLYRFSAAIVNLRNARNCGIHEIIPYCLVVHIASGRYFSLQQLKYNLFHIMNSFDTGVQGHNLDFFCWAGKVRCFSTVPMNEIELVLAIAQRNQKPSCKCLVARFWNAPSVLKRMGIVSRSRSQYGIEVRFSFRIEINRSCVWVSVWSLFELSFPPWRATLAWNEARGYVCASG